MTNQPTEPMEPTDWTDPERLFSYHRPSEANVETIRMLRGAHKELAYLLHREVPACPELTLALRALHTCSMHATFALVADDPIAD